MNEQQNSIKSDKQQRSKETALPILATCANYSEAARQIGCSREEIYNWLKDPEFKAELERLRTDIVNDAISQLKNNATKATNTLVNLLEDESSQVRLKAANDILNHLGRFMELRELETRLKALEDATRK
jgi:HEAT repeat protein